MASVANSCRRFIYINRIVRYSLREYPSRVSTTAGSDARRRLQDFPCSFSSEIDWEFCF